MAGSVHGGRSEDGDRARQRVNHPLSVPLTYHKLPSRCTCFSTSLPFGEARGGLFALSPRLPRGILRSPWRLCPALAGSPHPGGPLGQRALGA